MTLSHARYYRHDGYPMLRVEVDGVAVELTSDCKPTLHEAGIVVVPELAKHVPPIRFRPPSGGTTEIEGATRDPRLFALYDRFLRACNDGSFAEGPVPLPA